MTTMTSERTPTDEQTRALDLFATGDSLAIEAGAGTGKTSTLEMIAASTPKRGQYVTFTRNMVEEAAKRFPPAVSCRTAHSLAFRAVGKPFAHRLNSPRMRSSDLATALGILRPIDLQLADGRTKRLQPYRLAGIAKRGVGRFCQTADEEPTRMHVPYIKGIDEPGEYLNNNIVAKLLEPAMKRLWADVTNPRGNLPFSHDHYLKLWQLSDPRINTDYIMFDEAQDANPVMQAIVAAQSHAQLVWVGDSQQQIFAFTGAVNALSRVPAENRTFLTQSFRFGQEIADVANEFLEMLNAQLRLTGTETIDSYVRPISDPRAVLTRTNAYAVESVLYAQRSGRRAHLIGGGGEVKAFARAAQQLMTRGSTEYPDLACFDSWDEVRQYVQTDELGDELKMMVRLVDEFGVDTILAALDDSVPQNRADVVVSTAHKAKGCEWDTVQIGADFDIERSDPEELRLRYVAVTRAKFGLDREALVDRTVDA